MSRAGGLARVMFACKKDMGLDRMPTMDEFKEWKKTSYVQGV